MTPETGMATQDTVRLVQNFSADPASYWHGNDRQTKKTIQRLRAIKRHYSWNNNDLSWFSLEAAKWRIKTSQQTFYLPNFGSSGSHLIQRILGDCRAAHPLGEVYIAKGFVREVEKLEPDEQCLAMEAYHLLHSPSPEFFFSRSVIINTAHVAALTNFADWTINYKALLITRDPVDLVISRTFRKQEYRQYLGRSTVTDMEYLDHNIDQALKFFQAALKQNYPGFIRFEDVISRPDDAASILYPFVEGRKIDMDGLTQRIKNVTQSGQGTNKYSGSEVPVDTVYVTHARERLRELSSRLGY